MRRRERARETVDAVYRADSRRVLATLIRLLGDFDLAEEALHDAFARGGRAVAARRRARQPARLARLGRPLQGDRRACAAARASTRRWRELADAARRAVDATAAGPTTERRGRPAAADLHLLPSGAAAGRAGRADAARGVRPDDRGDRARVPRRRRRRWRSASSAPRRRSATRASRIRCPSRDELPERLDAVLHVDLPGVQRGLLGVVRRSRSRGTICRGEAIRLGRLLVELLPEPEALGLLALMLLHESRRRGARDRRRASWCCSTTRIASLWDRALIAEGLALVERALRVAALRALHAAGGDRRGARRGRDAPRHRLGADRRALRRAAACRPVAGRRAEPRRRGRDARRPAAGLALIDAILARGDLRRLPPRALGARRSVPAAGTNRRRARVLPAGAGADQQEPERRFLERRLRELDG